MLTLSTIISLTLEALSEMTGFSYIMFESISLYAEALKNLINYQFIAWLSAYKDVLLNVLWLKPVISDSSSKVNIIIVESVNIIKIEILIIRFVFGRIQALKNLINYQFIAWLSAYKDVLSNIL